MISTATMIKLGKVFENLMIDVKMSNEKLIARGVLIVMNVTDCEKSIAEEYIKRYQSAKMAIFAILTGIVDEQKIKEHLQKSKNNLRKALQENR